MKAEKSWYEEVLDAELKKAKIFGYKREHMFHPTRKFRFDFAWPEQHIAIEIEGGIWLEGRHNRPDGFTEDCIKYNEAVLHGWRVLRFTSKQVEDGVVLPMLRELMREEHYGRSKEADSPQETANAGSEGSSEES